MNAKRLLVVALAPVAALLAAAAYTDWRADRVERDVAAFCSSIATGITLRHFAELALEHDFEVSDRGAGSNVLTAAKTAYKIGKHVYACHADHDGERVIGTRFEHRSE